MNKEMLVILIFQDRKVTNYSTNKTKAPWLSTTSSALTWPLLLLSTLKVERVLSDHVKDLAVSSLSFS